MQVSHDSAWDEFLDEFINIFSVYDLNKNKIFICGSYDENTFANLQEIQKIINQVENNLGFFEKDFSYSVAKSVGTDLTDYTNNGKAYTNTLIRNKNKSHYNYQSKGKPSKRIR